MDVDFSTGKIMHDDKWPETIDRSRVMRVWNYRQPIHRPDGWPRQTVTFCDDCCNKAPNDHERVCEAHELDACDVCGYPYDESGDRIDELPPANI